MSLYGFYPLPGCGLGMVSRRMVGNGLGADKEIMIFCLLYSYKWWSVVMQNISSAHNIFVIHGRNGSFTTLCANTDKRKCHYLEYFLTNYVDLPLPGNNIVNQHLHSRTIHIEVIRDHINRFKTGCSILWVTKINCIWLIIPMTDECNW